MIYRKYSDTEFTWNNRSELFTTINFFVSYDYGDEEIPGTLIKHGNEKDIERYSIKKMPIYQLLEQEQCFANTKHFVVDVTKIALENLDEINKCLEITGYVGVFLKKFNLLPDEYDDCEII